MRDHSKGPDHAVQANRSAIENPVKKFLSRMETLPADSADTAVSVASRFSWLDRSLEPRLRPFVEFDVMPLTVRHEI